MIYMVDHVYNDPRTEEAWHEWYAAYLHKLLSVPGIHSAQRFKAVACTPSRYLAMYSIDSADVYTSEGYKRIGGGGSQSARFHDAYQLWTRNLFAGVERAPGVTRDQRLAVMDADRPRNDGPLGQRAVWLQSVGLHMTTAYRAFVVLDVAEAMPLASEPGVFVYEPFTEQLVGA